MVIVDEATVGADLREAYSDPVISAPINAPACVEEVGARRLMIRNGRFLLFPAKVY
jgi:hypothetical protein